MKLTAPQMNGLRYFLAIETKTNHIGRFQTRYKAPDPRVIDKLRDLGLITVKGWNYGALWELTETGRSIAWRLDERYKCGVAEGSQHDDDCEKCAELEFKRSMMEP
jgi:hypothetical protein